MSTETVSPSRPLPEPRSGGGGTTRAGRPTRASGWRPPVAGGRRGVWSVLQPVAAIGSVVALIGAPLWLVLVTSAKPQGEALTPSFALPSDWQLFENYRTVFTDGDIPAAFFGSLLIMVPAVIGVLVLGSMASWVLARRSSRMNAMLYALAISGIVLPPAIVTVVLLLRQLGIAGTAVGMIAVYMGMYMSTVIFFVTGFVRTVPLELEEAARVDGARPVTVFVRIILPLLMPVLSTATILICLYVWNDVFYAFFVVGGRMDTLPLNLFQVASTGLYLNNWHLIFAYVVLMSLPLLLVFTFAQRKIISGVTSGAVK